MTVQELIIALQAMDETLLVCYGMYSDNCILEATDLKVERHGLPRRDGWVAGLREDKPSREYLVFPGN